MKITLSSHRLIVNLITSFCLYSTVIGLFAGCGGITPYVPVVVTMRDSLVGEGKVAIFSNQTPNRLTITVTVENKQNKKRQSVNIDLDPNGNREFGWLEGWKFMPGETITVSYPGYLPFTRIVQ